MKAHKAAVHGIAIVWNKNDGKERNKWGHIIRRCEFKGCDYKTSVTTSMKRHRAVKHGIKAVWKDDGRERDRSGHIVKDCGIGDCTYRTGNTGTMKRHRLAIHGIDTTKKQKKDPGVLFQVGGQGQAIPLPPPAPSDTGKARGKGATGAAGENGGQSIKKESI
mmetsp:Transcript_13680/g.27248  ORF Transcript_13680/g.27248 Transcript_13680/m.27248 type:complete len:163 (+) Transcript_13680:723-1211(+)